MNVTGKIETLTIEDAKALLATSYGNRNLRPKGVLEILVEMEKDTYSASARDIVIDEHGNLLDGHHALTAQLAFGKPVKYFIKRGCPKSDSKVIDTGRSRNLTDLANLETTGEENINARNGILRTCVKLLVGSAIPIRTLVQREGWLRYFKPGIDMMFNLCRNDISESEYEVNRRFLVSPIAGGFAFAHRTAPEKIEKALRVCLVGEGLTKGDPELPLRTLIVAGNIKHSGGGINTVTLKVLNALHARLTGKPLREIKSKGKGLEYFREVYDTRSVNALVTPWTNGKMTEIETAVATSTQLLGTSTKG